MVGGSFLKRNYIDFKKGKEEVKGFTRS